MNTSDTQENELTTEYIPRGFVLSTTTTGGIILLQFTGRSEMLECANYLTKNQMKVTKLEDFNFTIKEVFKPGDVFKTNADRQAKPRFYCPHHNTTELKPSRKLGVLYCPHRLADGSYCKFTLDA